MDYIKDADKLTGMTLNQIWESLELLENEIRLRKLRQDEILKEVSKFIK